MEIQPDKQNLDQRSEARVGNLRLNNERRMVEAAGVETAAAGSAATHPHRRTQSRRGSSRLV